MDRQQAPGEKNRPSAQGAGHPGLPSLTTDLDLIHQVNFILFIRIIRILVQKLRSPDVGKSDSSPYS